MSTTTSRNTRLLYAAVLITALLAGACGFQRARGPVAGAAGNDDRPKVTVDWSARTIEGDLGDRWDVAFCEGEAPFICVKRDGAQVGAIELLDYDPAGPSLEKWAKDHLAWLNKDRSEGCPAGYEIVGDKITHLKIAGRPAVRLSFTGTDSSGADVERGVLHSVVIDGRQYLISALGYDEDSCLGRTFSDFTVEELRAFEPTLSQVVLGSLFGPPVRIAG